MLSCVYTSSFNELTEIDIISQTLTLEKSDHMSGSISVHVELCQLKYGFHQSETKSQVT